MAGMGDHEEFEVDAGVGAFDDHIQPGPGHEPGGAPRRPGWLGWTLAAVALVLGGVLAVPPNATLGPPPVWGRLTGLEEPVVEAWSSNVDLGADEQAFEVHLLADVVLVPVRAFDPDLRPVASTILAFDAHDGALLWTLSEETLTCARPQTSLVCVTGSGADASILSIDLTTGDVRRTAAPQALAAAEHDGDLIVLRADPDGERVIRYRGWTTANEQWRRVVGPIAGETSYYRRSIEPSAGQLVISSTRGAVLDADTGEVLLENTTAYKVSDDVVVVAEPNGGQLRFYPLHGNDVITRPRDASPICVDDDPRADLYISRLPDQPTAVSASTGDTLWTAAIADSPAHTVARQRGTIIVRTEANLYGLDATTGDQLWSNPVTNQWSLCYAGDGVLLTTTSDDGPSSLAGLEIETGETRWTADLPGTPMATSAEGRRLAIITDDGSLTMWQVP